MNSEKDVIHLSKKELYRIYQPWINSVIIKVFGRKVPYIYLKQKLQDLWKSSKQVTLINLGNDYHVVKFQSEANKNKVLHEGPWFVAGNFMSVRKWEPNFVPNEETITRTTIWEDYPNYLQNSMTK